MALYEYKCEDDHLTTRLAKISDPDEPKKETICEICGKSAKHVLSSTDFKLKGKWFKNAGGY